jgi:hypothetical protein
MADPAQMQMVPCRTLPLPAIEVDSVNVFRSCHETLPILVKAVVGLLVSQVN